MPRLTPRLLLPRPAGLLRLGLGTEAGPNAPAPAPPAPAGLQRFTLPGGSARAPRRQSLLLSLVLNLALQTLLAVLMIGALGWAPPPVGPERAAAAGMERFLLAPPLVWRTPPSAPRFARAHPAPSAPNRPAVNPSAVNPSSTPFAAPAPGAPAAGTLATLVSPMSLAPKPPAPSSADGARFRTTGFASAAEPRPAAPAPAPVLVGGFGRAAGAPGPSGRSTSRPEGLALGGFRSGSGKPAPAAPPPRATGGGEAGFSPAQPASSPLGPAPGAVRLEGFAAAPPPEAVPAPAALSPASPPLILHLPVPAYTAAARAHRLEGDVVLEVRLEASGAVEVLRVVRSLGDGLDQAAISAARQLQFRPASRHGQPVDGTVLLHVEFRLAS